MITRKQLIELHKLVDKTKPETYSAAALKLVMLKRGITNKNTKSLPSFDPDQGRQILQGFYQALLEEEKYTEAALLAWGPDVFNPEPPETQRMFKAFDEENIVFMIGGAGLGKTYATVARILMDWSRDPENTNWKLVSTSEGHARSNTWSTLCELHSTSIIPIPGKPQTDFLGMSNTSRQAAIAIVKIPTGDDGKGRLQGFHPLPRKEKHHRFGNMTRVGAFIDEAEKVPVGTWVGVENMLSSMTPDGHVKVYAATNPDDIGSIFALKAQPPQGWDAFDEEKDFEWKTEEGIKVVRLDPKFSTNVRRKYVVFGGMQTWEGYAKYENQGPHSKAYWTFGRGAYPRANVEFAIIPSSYLQAAVGNFHWVTMPYNIASFDGAFAEGGDDPILTTGRYGMALKDKKICPVVLAEQQFAMKKKNAHEMMEDMIKLLKTLYVKPEHFIMDSTGNGIVFHDGMKVKFGNIWGVQWASEPTDKKILEEDTLKASDQFKNIISEMWVSASRWLEFGYVKFAPTLITNELFLELTSRKHGRFYKVESKLDYKKRTKRNSPDKADSFIMLIHLCRMLNDFGRPKMIIPPERSDFVIGAEKQDLGDMVEMIEVDKI